MSKDTKKEPIAEVETEAVQPVLKPYLFPEREVSILAESLEQATEIYNSQYPSNA